MHLPWNERIKRRLKLRDLDILMALIEAGSMGKAASRLNVTQSAVSKAIAMLESALGVQLVERGQRGITPTSYGMALKKRSVAIFNDLRQGVQDIDFLSDPTKGELRIGSTEPVGVAMVVPCINRLSSKYPGVGFHVIAADTASLYRELVERNVEIVMSRMIGALPEELSAEVLFHDSLAVLTSAKNPLTRRRKLTLAELMNEPWAQLPSGSLFGSIVDEAFRAAGYEPPRPTVSTLSNYMMDDLLASGRFLTVMPSFMVKATRRSLALKALLEFPNTRRPIGLITLKNRMLTPLAQLFIESIRAIAKPMAHCHG